MVLPQGDIIVLERAFRVHDPNLDMRLHLTKWQRSYLGGNHTVPEVGWLGALNFTFNLNFLK